MSGESIITIGNFDGVHAGHRAIVRAARGLADERLARVVAVTFDPPPVAVLKPCLIPPQVASLADRQRWLVDAGADEVVVLTPGPELLGLSAEQFIEKLIDEHGAVGFVEGEDFRFGKRRGGDMAMLAAMGESRGFAVRALGRVEVKLSDQSVAPVSSSLIRWLVGRGRVEDAGACLGRDWELTSTVVQGERRGRTIGIPTANLDPEGYRGMIVPMDGVYAGSAVLPDGGTFAAAISVGTKPTFGERRLTIEAHLIDYAGPSPDNPDSLYGQPLTLRFARWVRDQYPFPNADELVARLRRDIDLARRCHDDALSETC